MKCNRCGKENVDPVYPHTCTPLAIALAERLDAETEKTVSIDLMHFEAAVELRRLHAENEALKQALHTEEAISFRHQLHAVQAENEALKKQIFEIRRGDREANAQ